MCPPSYEPTQVQNKLFINIILKCLKISLIRVKVKVNSFYNLSVFLAISDLVITKPLVWLDSKKSNQEFCLVKLFQEV